MVGTMSQSDDTTDGQVPFSDSILALQNMCFTCFGNGPTTFLERWSWSLAILLVQQ